MSFSDFHSMLINIYITLLAITQRGAVFHELITDISNEAATSGLVIGINKIDRPQSSLGQSPKHPFLKALAKESDQEADLGAFTDVPELKCKENLFALKDESGNILPAGNAHKDSRDRIQSTFLQNIQESSDTLYGACELGHIRCAKLLTIRCEQNIKLNTIHFFRLYGATWEFLLASESLCGRICFPLKGCLLSQAKFYIQHFHEEKSKQIALLLENEQWVQTDIPFDFQHITEQLQLSKNINRNSTSEVSFEYTSMEVLDDEIEVDLTSKLASKFPNDGTSPSLEPSPICEDPNRKTLRFLMIDGAKYYVVISTLMFIKTLTEYVLCAERLQMIVPEIMNRIFELLKVCVLLKLAF
jgi:hypothetical protein